MKVTIAIDSFKGSLSSRMAEAAASEGVLSVYPDATCKLFPIADGGEGTVAALAEALGAVMVECEVSDPRMRRIRAEYGYVSETATALIEMSAAAGLPLLTPELRNPMYTTTYGVGEMIRDAIARGARHFIIGIGGSATNDGGAGMLMALGFGLLDSSGEPIRLGAIGLKDLAKIDTGSVLPELRECEFLTLCDVKNPLLGPDGASHVYGGQKGADEAMRYTLDEYLSHYARVTRVSISGADESCPGTGAAGGLGFALLSFLGAKLVSGIDEILALTGVEDSIKDSDLVLTGEGKLDSQSYMGKAPVGVSTLAMAHGVPCIAFAGAVTGDITILGSLGITDAYAISPIDMPLELAMREDVAYENMKRCVEAVFMKIKNGEQ